MTFPSDPVLAAGVARRIGLLDSAFPVLMVEGTPGAGKRTLLRQWAAAVDEPELRILFDAERTVTDSDGLLWAIWRRIAQHTTVGREAVLAESDDPLQELRRALPRILRPVVIAVSGADALPAQVFATLLKLLIPRDFVRIIVAGFDLVRLADVTRHHGVPFARLDDDDLAFTVAEVERMLADAPGVELDARTIFRNTLGLPGIVRAAIDDAVQQSAGGGSSPTLALATGDIGGYLFTRGVQDWPSPLVRFITTMVHLPQFTIEQAAVIADANRTRILVDRMVGLHLGRMSYNPALRRRVFCWFEPSRLTALLFLRENEDDEQRADRLRRTIDAARVTFDRVLLTTAMVATGRLRAVEDSLRDWLWDCLPNGFTPQWSELADVSPLDVVQYPRLLVARLRVEPARDGSVIGQRAAAQVMAQLRDTSYTNPWHRLEDLALLVELARVRSDVAAMAENVSRARKLLADLLHGEFHGSMINSAVSSVLLLADATFRLGNHAIAADFAAIAIQVIDVGSRRLDPWGERRGFASRVLLAGSRARGFIDPVDATVALSAPQFRWRDTDVVAQTLAQVWEEIDAGNFAAADQLCAQTLQTVARDDHWPSLWLSRLWLLGLQQESTRAEQVRLRYDAACAQLGLDDVVPDETPAWLDWVAQAFGPHMAPPRIFDGSINGDRGGGAATAAPDSGAVSAADVVCGFVAGGAAAPRWAHNVELLEALTALRAGRLADAQQALVRCIAQTTSRPLSPAVLAAASVAEVRELAELIADHPQAESLQLEQVLAVAGRVSAGVTLSEREQQVLEFLRQGMTNIQIAKELFVSVNTVKFHRGNLMKKLGASTRQELLEAAGRAGL